MQAKLTDFDEKKLPDLDKGSRLAFVYFFIGFAGISMILFGFINAVKFVEGRNYNVVLSLLGVLPLGFAYAFFWRSNKSFATLAESFSPYSCEQLYERVTGKISERHFRIVLSHRARTAQDSDYLKYRIAMSQPEEARSDTFKVLDKHERALKELGVEVLRKRDKALKLKQWRWLVVLCAAIGFAPGIYSLLPGASTMYQLPWFSSLVGIGVFFAMYGGVLIWLLRVNLAIRTENLAVRRVFEKFDLDALRILIHYPPFINDAVWAIGLRKKQGDAGATELYKTARKLQSKARGF